jgi:protein-tyrosine-phosphatase/DNA-binding transcriptional ArsR family regulator
METLPSITLAPDEFLKLAGHALRWKLLEQLALSDRNVQELAERVGEPHNLVSYHLGKLRKAGLVSAHRSSADRRDTYYGADLSRFGAALSRVGASLHPGLRLAPTPTSQAPASTTRVLFLCTGNSARSQMAEALLRARSGPEVEVASAGSHPKAMHPNALRVMQEDYGLDMGGQAPKGLERVADRDFDWVISLCDQVREACPEFPAQPRTIHWSIPNPATGEPDDLTYPEFRKTAADLSTRIDFLTAALAHQGPAA